MHNEMTSSTARDLLSVRVKRHVGPAFSDFIEFWLGFLVGILWRTPDYVVESREQEPRKANPGAIWVVNS